MRRREFFAAVGAVAVAAVMPTCEPSLRMVWKITPAGEVRIRMYEAQVGDRIRIDCEGKNYTAVVIEPPRRDENGTWGIVAQTI